MTPARLALRDIDVTLGGRRVLTRLTIDAAPGHVVGIVGPNGSGKSTALRVALGLLRPAAGRVMVDDVDVASTSPGTLARTMAAVLQDTTGDFDLTVSDVVSMGRACHKRLLDVDRPRDHRAVADAMALVDVGELAHRRFASLSGGERQRVLIARAVAQEPRLLVMDEPTNHLDVKNQFDALALPRTLGVTALVALHDLNLAAHYCDEIHVLDGGRQVRSGEPAQVLTPDLLTSVYGVEGSVAPHDVTGRPHVAFTPPSP